MIRPPGFRGVAFTDAAAGDVRHDAQARRRAAASLTISPDWATVRQVHGSVVVEADGPGDRAEADGVYTVRRGLPVAVFTADCLSVAVEADQGVGIAHAGWRGVVAGVVQNLLKAMSEAGWTPGRAAIGPGIGPCCFEVGPEVAGRFPDHLASTSWDTVSVDLSAAIASQLDGIETWQAESCTRCENGFFSHRRDGTAERMAGIVWLP